MSAFDDEIPARNDGLPPPIPDTRILPRSELGFLLVKWRSVAGRADMHSSAEDFWRLHRRRTLYDENYWNYGDPTGELTTWPNNMKEKPPWFDATDAEASGPSTTSPSPTSATAETPPRAPSGT